MGTCGCSTPEGKQNSPTCINGNKINTKDTGWPALATRKQRASRPLLPSTYPAWPAFGLGVSIPRSLRDGPEARHRFWVETPEVQPHPPYFCSNASSNIRRPDNVYSTPPPTKACRQHMTACLRKTKQLLNETNSPRKTPPLAAANGAKSWPPSHASGLAKPRAMDITQLGYHGRGCAALLEPCNHLLAIHALVNTMDYLAG